MKLLRYGEPGREAPGLLASDGVIRDLSAHLDDLTPDQLNEEALARIAALDVAELPEVAGSPRLGVPFTGTRQFIAIGLNFSEHAVETGQKIPKEPIIFSKGVSCIQGACDDVRRPRASARMDWEVELGVVIGRRGSYIDEADVMSHIAGYCVVDDLSEREFQFERSGTWVKGKGCPTFGPVGPWLVTKDEIRDVQNLGMWLNVNGQRMQTGNTGTMIFSVPYLVHYVSQFMELLPGDIITTGTPPGSGVGMNPPIYLGPGDVVELGIDGLGTQRHAVLDWDE